MGNKYGYPIANWLDESTYPDSKKMSGPEMAWEYIRRNPEYQKDFEKCKNPPSLRYKWNLVSKWFRENSAANTLLDPMDDKPSDIKSRLKYRPTIFLSSTYGQRDNIISPFFWKNDIGAIFNLDQPISPQTKTVEKYLIKEQKKRKIKISHSTPNRGAHLIFWRIIDAKAQKIPPREIRKFFKFKKSDYDAEVEVDQLKDRLRDALDWRDSRYIALVNLRQPSPPKKQKKRRIKATKPIPK